MGNTALVVSTAVEEIRPELEQVIVDLVAARFDGYEPPIELIASQITELRRQPVLGAWS